MRPASTLAAAAVLAAASPCPAADGDGGTVVTASRPRSAASSETVRDRDLMLRPHRRPADILQVTPGLLVFQHAGGGKANQYFMRGFDLDHGTDLALFVDGVPVNMVSHGHGQGYADLHFVIPETVQRLEVRKGPYFAEFGDFANAGALNLVTRPSAPESAVSLGGGMFRSARGLLLLSPALEGWTPYLAAEVYHTDGPFERGESLDRYNLFTRIGRRLDDGSRLTLTLTGHASGWNASGQLPARAVEAGLVDRFGALDPAEGGQTQRHSAYLTWEGAPSADSALTALAYLVGTGFRLYSDFTFRRDDPVRGDLIRQTDDRTTFGTAARYRFLSRFEDLSLQTSLGVRTRSDLIDNRLDHAPGRTVRLDERRVDATIRESSLSLWAEEEVSWTKWLRTTAGARLDYFAFDVEDHLGEGSGVRDAALVSPKASAVATPAKGWDLFLNFGFGFHSNDARGVVRTEDPVTPLTRARGWELGSRAKLFGRLDLAADAFLIDLDREIVWVGDEGTTEVSGATRRVGVEGEARLALLPWLWADADATWTHAAYRETGEAVALAPDLTLSAGLSARHPDGWYGRIGAMHVGDRPASEDRFLTAEGFTRGDATLGWRVGDAELSLELQNLGGAEWREAQFATVSRLEGENGPEACPSGTRAVSEAGRFRGCEDVNFTPGTPFSAQAALTLYY